MTRNQESGIRWYHTWGIVGELHAGGVVAERTSIAIAHEYATPPPPTATKEYALNSRSIFVCAHRNLSPTTINKTQKLRPTRGSVQCLWSGGVWAHCIDQLSERKRFR